jgi:hypothetical protein
MLFSISKKEKKVAVGSDAAILIQAALCAGEHKGSCVVKE